MESFISDTELRRLAGEVLPPRMALSTVITPVVGNGGGGNGGAPVQSGGGDDGTTVAYACQTHQDPGPPALLAALGLGPTTPATTTTCVPAAISGH